MPASSGERGDTSMDIDTKTANAWARVAAVV